MTPQERLAYLLESVFIPTHAAVTISDITAAVGDDAARLAVGTITAASAQDPLLGPALTAMSTTGIDLSAVSRQAMVDQLAVAGSWPNVVRDKIKALGGTTKPRWKIEGYIVQPTLQQVTDEATRADTRNWWNARSAVVADGLHSGTITTQQQVIDAIGGA